jgi:outer membrane protein OmpU
MKKVLFATTALVLTAGIAAADVTISGYGRTGVLYQEDGVDGEATNDAIIQARLRMNIDATTTTDSDVEFGGRIRIQWDQGDDETTVAPGYIYVTSNGLSVEIGNSNTAYDSVALMYNSEIGIYSRSFGNSRGNFFAYNTDGYPTFDNTTDNDLDTDYLGVMVSYTLDNLTVRASQVDSNQVVSNDGFEKEYGFSVDYVWNDMLTVAAAFVKDGSGIDGNDQYFLGAEYAFNEKTDIGLLYFDNGEDSDGSDADLGNTVTLYGSYEVAPMTVINAYVANNDADSNDTDNSYGIGAEYDLGGAKLAGSVQRGYDELVTADMGVRFDF